MPHLASRVRPGVDVVFLDTGYHFAETIGTRDAVAATLPVTVRSIRPRQTVAEQDASFGVRLYERNPDQCCALRKVDPAAAGAAGLPRLGVGIAPRRGRRRARDVKVVEWDARRSMVKLNPIAAWTQHDVDAYIAEHGVIVNPLLVRRLRLDRLRTVHTPDQARRGPARRALGRDCRRRSAASTTPDAALG